RRWEPAVATSAVTGEGLDDLRAALRRLSADLAERRADDLFRLPIDRVFAVAGAGTVVTGSTWSGSVAVGDAVRLLPLDREVRVRSIEVHGQGDDRAGPGRRTALALVGVDKEELARGDVAVTGEGWAATTALDAAGELLPAPGPAAAAADRDLAVGGGAPGGMGGGSRPGRLARARPPGAAGHLPRRCEPCHHGRGQGCPIVRRVADGEGDPGGRGGQAGRGRRGAPPHAPVGPWHVLAGAALGGGRPGTARGGRPGARPGGPKARL